MNFNKKILYITYESLLTPNGVSVHVSKLIDYIETASVVTIRNKFNTRIHIKEINLEAVTKFNEIIYFRCKKLRSSIKKVRENEVIHFHLTNFSALFFLAIARFFNKKIICTFHTIPILKANFILFLEALRVVIVYNFFVLFSNDIIILSLSQKELVGRYILFKSLLEKKSTIINGFISGRNIKTRNKSSDKLTLIYVGRLEVEKGFNDLIEVLRIFRDDSICFYIAGTGSLVGKIPKDLKNVFYLGSLKNEEVLEYMSKSDMLISFSHNEVSPVVILEAMSQGLAIVSTGLPTIKDILVEDENAYYFPVGDIKRACQQIRSLNEDRNKLQMLKKNNLIKVKKYFLENQIGLYFNIYSK